jgi:hypothetical protein
VDGQSNPSAAPENVDAQWQISVDEKVLRCSEMADSCHSEPVFLEGTTVISISRSPPQVTFHD